MEPPQYSKPRPYGTSMKVAIPPPTSSSSEIDRSSNGNKNGGGELRGLDCNLSSLCDHIQIEGFNSAAFSDVIVQAMGSTYHLHRLILSRSSYFRNMLHGPWKEASAPILTLHIDDDNVNGEAIAMALAYLYGHHPNLNDNNAFRVLAAASFLDLQDLCAICTDFIVSELWTSNFLAYQVFAEGQDYGIHGERVRNACWGYLCQSGAMELKEALLISDELWVPTEEKRFELALYTLLAKGVFSKSDTDQGSSTHEMGEGAHSDSTRGSNDKSTDRSTDNQMMGLEMGHLSVKDDCEGHKAAHNILVELADRVVDFHSGTADSEPQDKPSFSQLNEGARYAGQREKAASLTNTFSHPDGSRTSCSYVEMLNGVEASRMRGSVVAMEGPSEDSSCYQLNNSIWLPRDQSRQCSSEASSCNFMPNEWGRCNMPPPPWGGRIVGRRQVKNYAKGNCGIHGEEYDAFINIFEGGSLLYCNMSFDALLNVRKQLEELGFPCKAINDGLWLQENENEPSFRPHDSVYLSQAGLPLLNAVNCGNHTVGSFRVLMLLSHRVQEVGDDTCKSCCLPSIACACRQSYGFSQGVTTTGYYMQEHDHPPGNMGNLYGADHAQGEGNSFSRPVRVNVRGPIDGLAGIGRGTTFVHSTAWPPTRFVFSRVPFGLGNRNGQQSLANDESEARADLNGELSGDGLTALVGLTQGGNVHGDQSQRGYDPDQQGRFAGGGNGLHIHGDQSERGYDADLRSRFGGASVSGQSASSIPVQMLEPHGHDIGLEWENANESSISLDIKTPLRDFPPFRFGVEFEDVHRLTDGQVKHSQEVFYAGSLWKVSVQAFNDEDPQGRRTLGLFLHRRKAEINEFQRKVHLYTDSREKVTARYQLICPSKREVMVFGSFKQAGTLLPKAPKGWGWRTALLFDELGDLLQGGALRVAAVVQLV